MLNRPAVNKRAPINRTEFRVSCGQLPQEPIVSAGVSHERAPLIVTWRRKISSAVADETAVRFQVPEEKRCKKSLATHRRIAPKRFDEHPKMLYRATYPGDHSTQYRTLHGPALHHPAWLNTISKNLKARTAKAFDIVKISEVIARDSNLKIALPTLSASYPGSGCQGKGYEG
jgi:hypothetical protein